MKILVIDDEQDIRDGCERILSRMDYGVLTAPRGEKGLEMIKSSAGAIRIVLLDLKMPGMDGMEVLHHIREMDESILVIIITGFATVETAIEAMKRGAYDFLPKPFEPDHVRIVVKRAIEKILLTAEAKKLEAQRRKMLLDLDAEKSRTRTIIETLPGGVVVTNTQGQVVLMNPAFLRRLGLSQDRKAGEHIGEYIQDEGFCNYIESISKGDVPEKPDYEIVLSGQKYLLARGRAVQSEDGEYLGAAVTITDITNLKVLDQLKSEFVAKVSHELRSPLATIHEQLALVLREIGEESGKDHHLIERAKEKTHGLISLIGDLLDLSRIESGMHSKQVKPVRLDELLASIVDFLSARSNAKKQSLTFDKPAQSLPEITADPMALESIFGNLVTNAINYTPEGGKIEVKAGIENGDLWVTVQDNGFGIAPKDQEMIFERFYRVKNEKTRYITGTGLGLPIVKGLVDSLKGSITVESEIDKGTTFKVVLPIGEE